MNISVSAKEADEILPFKRRVELDRCCLAQLDSETYQRRVGKFIGLRLRLTLTVMALDPFEERDTTPSKAGTVKLKNYEILVPCAS